MCYRREQITEDRTDLVKHQNERSRCNDTQITREPVDSERQRYLCNNNGENQSQYRKPNL